MRTPSPSIAARELNPGGQPLDIALAALTAILGGLLLWFGVQLTGGRSAPLRIGEGSSTSEMLGLAAAGTGLAICIWWATSLILALAAELLRRTGRLRSARATAALTPPFMRRLAAVLLGVSLVAGAPAHATAPVQQETTVSAPARADIGLAPAWAVQADNTAVDPGWRPTPVPVSGSLLVRPPQRSPDAAASTHRLTVSPGDSLWTLSAEHLGPLATDAEIAAFWPELYSVNRHIIGENPELLQPGQLLQLPHLNER